jgi:hypothetical protein
MASTFSTPKTFTKPCGSCRRGRALCSTRQSVDAWCLRFRRATAWQAHGVAIPPPSVRCTNTRRVRRRGPTRSPRPYFRSRTRPGRSCPEPPPPTPEYAQHMRAPHLPLALTFALALSAYAHDAPPHRSPSPPPARPLPRLLQLPSCPLLRARRYVKQSTKLCPGRTASRCGTLPLGLAATELRLAIDARSHVLSRDRWPFVPR